MTDRERSDTPPYPVGAATPVAMLAEQLSRVAREVSKIQELTGRLVERSEEHRRAADRFAAVEWPRLESDLSEVRSRVAAAEAKLLAVELFRKDVHSLRESIDDLKRWRDRVMGGLLVVSALGSGLGAAVLELARWLVSRP